MLRRFVVKKGERALLMRNGEFVDILHSGTHWYFDPLRCLAAQTFSLDEPRFEHPLAQHIPVIIASREFHTVCTGSSEVGLRYENGALVEVLPPNAQRWYWRGPIDVRCVVLDIRSDFTVARSLVPLLASETTRILGADGVMAARVPERHCGLLMVDGKVARRLDPGLHAFWRFGRDMKVELVDWGQEARCANGREVAAA